MKGRHLTEEEIQDFLDGNFSDEKTNLKHHLETCRICQNTLKQYQSLYAGLEIDPGYTLSKAFAKSIVSKLSLEHASPFSSPSAEIAFIIAGIFLALGATLFFVDLRPLAETVSRIALPKAALSTSILQPIRNLLAGLNGSLYLLPFAGLALLSVAALDRFIHKLKHHKLFYPTEF